MTSMRPSRKNCAGSWTRSPAGGGAANVRRSDDGGKMIAASETPPVTTPSRSASMSSVRLPSVTCQCCARRVPELGSKRSKVVVSTTWPSRRIDFTSRPDDWSMNSQCTRSPSGRSATTHAASGGAVSPASSQSCGRKPNSTSGNRSMASDCRSACVPCTMPFASPRQRA